MTVAKRKSVPLGRAYDYDTSSEVVHTIDLFNPQGGSNPELMRQWHLKRLGDVGTIWNEYTGKGVSVGVYDDGIESGHWDLAANYDSSRHVVIDGETLDGSIGSEADSRNDPHGTAVAGLIAAARNGRGGVGVAYDAALTSVNIFDPGSPIFVNGPNGVAFLSAMRQADRFDVVNHSWGGMGDYLTQFSRSNPESFSARLSETFQAVANSGRGGLGTINVMASGNDTALGQSHNGVTDRHVIAVAAYREVDGAAAYYSNTGGHLLVSSPSSDFGVIGGTGLVTTDLSGSRGYNWSIDPGAPNDYTDSFGGTSGAAPIVTGVVALMLDANETLGWRDVQNILAASAKMPISYETGPVVIDGIGGGGRVTVVLNESRFKLTGAEANWNGGAMHYSTDYGYGAVDAYNAVRMAEVWSLFGPAKTSLNEVHVSQSIEVGLSSSSSEIYRGNIIDFSREIAGNPATKTFEIVSDINLERLDLTINFTALQKFTDGNTGRTAEGYGGLFTSQIKLVAPDGSEIFTPIVGYVIGDTLGLKVQEFTLGFSGLRGVETKGSWTLDFSALDMSIPFLEFPFEIDNHLTVNSITMDMYGSRRTTDDVYTYTDEYFTMAAITGEGERRTLSDADGGEDWINAAAVRADVHVSLVQGATTRFDGADAFTIASGSWIEHAVTGDGNDRLIGNALDNKLFGMRGDDWLNGGAGNDILFGGQGRDVFAFDTAGVSGNDKILDWSFGDRIATSKMLRGADQNGLLTVGSNALVLLDNTARGDTAELVGQGGAVLQALGRADGYWWYGFVSDGDEDFVDGRVTELALGQTGRPANDAGVAGPANATTGATTPGLSEAAFYLYDAMGDAMASGVVTYA